ncbi:glycosyltransferase family 87 protein [Sphingomicrobium marinum]|uniref:glycosyltransferase family 87 protein n=1 Tax=Sphingomicrobium marinum TaxID=1227950 RepID=UPI00223FACA4|nr:glycosyltransferase family 87 protein [Sphingomicrobium marinum]
MENSLNRKTYQRLITALCIVTAVRWALYLTGGGWVPDYGVFYAAAQFAYTDPSLIYDDFAMLEAQDWMEGVGPRPWAYPPSTLLLFLPFGLLPFLASYFAFMAFSMSAFFWAAKPYVEKAWPILLCADPVLFTLWSGQVTFIVGALILSGLTRLPHLSGGILLGIAAALKPQLLVLAPLCMIAGGHIKALIGSLVSGTIVGLLSFVLGIGLWFDWLESMPRFVETVQGMDILHRAVTPTGFLWHLGISGPVQWAVTITTCLFTAVAAWMIFHTTQDPRIRLVAMIGGGIWWSPYAMNYELAILCPVAAYLVAKASMVRAVTGIPLLFGLGWVAPLASFFFTGSNLVLEFLNGSRRRRSILA